MFYTFMQNNSGGRFDFDAATGVSHIVIVEARSAKSAVEQAEDIGLYFDGSQDCPCCGDRWYPVWDDTDGHAVPTVYGSPVMPNEKWISGASSLSTKWMGADPEGFIHYATGKVQPFWKGSTGDRMRGRRTKTAKAKAKVTVTKVQVAAPLRRFKLNEMEDGGDDA